MAVNPYFKKDYSAEQDILEDLTIEIIKTMGRDMYYIPRNILTEDKLFGEGSKVNYTTGIPIEMYIDSISGFDGQGDVASKFGIEVKDNIDLTVSKKRFNQEVHTKITNIVRPREGDLIYFPLANALFEINFVEHENPFYQFGKLYSYRLSCELFTYNEEEIITGNTEIDSVVTENQEFATIINIVNSVSGNTLSAFYLGEMVYQVDGITGLDAILDNATATGMVVNTSTNSSVYLSNISGIIKQTTNSNQTIKGTVSGLEFYVVGQTLSPKLILINNEDATPEGDNEVFDLEKKTQNIFDYDETDPFSEGKY